MSSKTLAVLAMAIFFHVTVRAVENGAVLPGNVHPAETLLALSPEESQWLENHKTIRIAYDGSLPPYSFVNDDGETDGIALEIMEVLSRRIGVEFKIYPKSDWTGIYKAAAKRKVDVVATMVKRPDRAEWFAFTKPYITKSLVIVTQAGNAAIRSREDLRAKKIAVVKGYQYAEQIGNEFPSAQRIYVDTMLDSLRQVVAGQADAAILFLGTANYLQSKYKLDNLKVAAFYDRNSANESIAVRKDWPILLAILQKGLDSLTEEEVQHIFAKWISGDPKSSPEKGTADAGELANRLPSKTKPSETVGDFDENPVVVNKTGQQSAVSFETEKADVAQTSGRHDRAETSIILSLIVLALFVAWWMLTRKQKKPMQAEQNYMSTGLRELQLNHSEAKQPRIEPSLEPGDESIIEEIQESMRGPQNEFIYYQHDCTGRFSYVSDSVTRLLGYTEGEFLEHYRDYLTDNPVNRRIDAYTDNCIKGYPNQPYEIEIFDKKGLKRRLEVMDTPVYDGQGHCIGVDGVMHEIVAPVEIYTEENTDDVGMPLDISVEIPTTDRQSSLLIKVKEAIETANQTQKSFVLIFLSLERLRMLDGSALNFAPDEVLDEAAKRLYSTLRSTDTVVELDNSQFALILPDTETGALGLIIDKIRKILQIPYLVGISSIVLDANIGSAVYPNSHQDPESLIEEAKVLLFSHDSEAAKPQRSEADDLLQDESLQIQQDLVAALDECKVTLRAKNTLNINALSRLSQFVVYYQSRHHAGTFDIAGFEALIRWHHPRLGVLLPKDFIELVKEVGMLDVLTYWIIQQVSFQAVAWEKAGVRPKVMAVNLEDLGGKHAVDPAKIVEIVTETGGKPEWLEFSVAEREIADDPDKLIPIVNQFVVAGLSVAIDNFGTESALLTQLKTIPAGVVEIDPEFIRGLPGNIDDADIVSYTVGMLHELGKTVIAKEVETEEQLACLKASGCDIIQGHLLSKPLPAKEAKSLIETLPDLVWYLRQK